MSRIVLVVLAISALAAAAQKSRGRYSESPERNSESWESRSDSRDNDLDDHSVDGYPRFPVNDYSDENSHESSPFFRRKRQTGPDTDIDPFVSPTEGLEQPRSRHGDSREDDRSDSRDHDHDDHDSHEFDNSDEFDNHRHHSHRQPQFIPGPRPFVVQNPQLVPMIPMAPVPIPAPQPIITAVEGDGLIVDHPQPVLPQPAIEPIPQILPLPEPLPQSGFRGPSGNFATTTTTSGGFRRPFPSTTTPSPLPGSIPSTLTCSSVRCPSGAVCRMENSPRSRGEEPVCVFSGSNSPSSCSQVKCSSGFSCEMQQSSSCSRRPCPLNPVCIQTPVATPPTVSCENVRCSAGTLCRIQTVDHCTSSPCAMQAVCISPCSTVNCPSNSECRVEERTMATSCVPNAPSRPSASCSGVRCDRGERCTIVKNCQWSRDCREEARCIRF